MKPTSEAYSELQRAYDHFNKRLFDNALPECLFTLQRIKNTFGYFSSEQFVNRDGKKLDELALNPTFFAVVPLVEIMQTLVHEMTHLWQQHNGKPGRGRYHNKQWGNKLESIGLMPSSTGHPGGQRTGDSMADYAIEDGLFLKACRELLTNDFKITWYDRFATPKAIQAGQNSFVLTLDLPEAGTSIAAHEEIKMSDEPISTDNKSNRSKYTCSCEINVWGKPKLNIRCDDCGDVFSEQG